MTIFVKPLLFKPHRLNGLSERLLRATTRTTTAARCVG